MNWAYWLSGIAALGIFITGFGYPVVPEGTARLRIQACATLTDAQIDFALATFEKVGKKLGVI